jgi:hypothetical protein
LKEDLFNSDTARMCLADVVFKEGHFNSGFCSSDRADFPLTGLSVRNLCVGIYKLLNNQKIRMSRQEKQMDIDNNVGWVGMAQKMWRIIRRGRRRKR